MKKQSPTEKQVERFADMGITPSDSKEVCRSMLEWIDSAGSLKGDRIAFVVATEATYLGKRVRNQEGSIGTVLWLVRYKQSFRASQENSSSSHPLAALVRWNSGKISTTSIASLTLA